MANQSNWWSNANTLRSIATITILSITIFTQSLSLYGQLSEINLLVWIYVVGFAGSFFAVSYLVLLAIAYEVCFNNLYGPYSVTAFQAAKVISFEFGGFLGLIATFLVTFG